MKFDSQRTDFAPYGFGCELWTPTPMPRPDRHNEIEINFLRSGTLTYLLGGRRTEVGAGRLVLFWAAAPSIGGFTRTMPRYQGAARNAMRSRNSATVIVASSPCGISEMGMEDTRATSLPGNRSATPATV